MQKATALALLARHGVQAEASPVNKIVSMLSELQAQITKEGEVAHQQYGELVETCEDRVRNLGFEIKTGTGEVESLKAAIGEEAATLSALSSKVEELAASLATNDADLKAATTIRTKEAADFGAEEKELAETIDMIGRAVNILEREMNKGGAAMMQVRNAGSLAQTFDAMVRASMITTGDASRLTAFVQDSQKAHDADEAPDAPAGAVYESQSGNIVDTLQDLSEKAESQLSDLRQTEVKDRHSFEQLKMSLSDEIKFASEDMAAAKKGIAESSEKKATATGDLESTSKELAEDVKAKAEVHQECETAAATHAAESKSRDEELQALTSAKKVIVESTGGAALDQVSFVQLASRKELHRYEAVRLVRDLARKTQSGSLAQLASQMTAAMQSKDAFEKVKGLISSMIARLEKEAGADATKKAYCDKELAESNEKKSDKTDEIEKISTRIERAEAASAQLKEEVATLQNELSKLAKTQAAMDKLRGEQKATYEADKAELEKGIAGLQQALKILNEYYAKDDKSHDSADGAASGIISLLEVCESDFSKSSAGITADEEAAAASYEATTKENEIDRTAKDQSVKYKTQESKALDKTNAELTSDRTGVQAELDAVSEYLSKIEEQCIAKAESFADRAARFASEIAGLKEALQILESETALVQQKSQHRRHAFLSLKA